MKISYKIVIAYLIILAVLTLPAWARQKHHSHHHHYIMHRHGHEVIQQHLGITRIETPWHIAAEVSSSFAGSFQGFFYDLASLGYHPHSIGCLSSGHTRNSKHHFGGACDIDQTARNRTDRMMYSSTVTKLARKWGLKSGCEFRNPDCGHVEVNRKN